LGRQFGDAIRVVIVIGEDRDAVEAVVRRAANAHLS
jgi:hypothetical protein